MQSRASVVLWVSVFLTVLGPAYSKPFFGELWCEVMCEDDDNSSTTTTSMEDLLEAMFIPDLCAGCGPRRRRPVARPPGAASPPLSIVVGPSSMNMSLTPSNGSWILSYLPGAAAAPAAPGQLPAASAPATSKPVAPAGAKPAAPAAAAATTKAPAGATTTTAKPTTKKK